MEISMLVNKICENWSKLWCWGGWQGPAVKMPMIGPFTTPPITMAASSIPGRYLCVLVDHFSHTKGKPDHKCDAECDSTKEECKYLGEESLDNRGLLSRWKRANSTTTTFKRLQETRDVRGGLFFPRGGARVKIRGAGRNGSGQRWKSTGRGGAKKRINWPKVRKWKKMILHIMILVIKLIMIFKD